MLNILIYETRSMTKTGTQSFTFHACCQKCILRRITSGNKLAIFYRLNPYAAEPVSTYVMPF